MSVPSPDVFEKLACFYLGKRYELDGGKLTDDLLMYDAKDLCTHAMCVGMTGSGKTGLCLALLEEAALDGVPAICIDPKGDLANLMLQFPELKPEDFRPWLDSGEATRKGMTLDDFAASTADKWKQGLASWGQTPDRIARLRDAADVAIYTPGSQIGLPMTVLKSFDAPPPALLDDGEAMRQRITGSASGLLTLMGIDADPLLSREHILISSILDHAWRDGRNVTIADLIGMIQSPPMTRVGVVDLDSFMSVADRGKLAMQLNNLLASPAFASWLEGMPLSIPKLLHTPEGKPRLSIISIAHLTDSERMFFVTILLNELIAWMRVQSGTSSLRAMLYMDEVAGYFPPIANPPSKPPMLTLLKQARAFGLGVTLATQNPVDLDYKGLSNIGTWFLGRLQTERDKARVLEGLEGASVQSGKAFDRGAMEQTLASLGNRVFLMSNVHEDAPVVFQSRWAMSFLAGPLARDQISTLMAKHKAAAMDRSAAAQPMSDPAAPSQPIVPAGVRQRFLIPAWSSRSAVDPAGRQPAAAGSQRRVYRPAIMGQASLRYVRSAGNVDHWVDIRRLLACGTGVPQDLWESSTPYPADVDSDDVPDQSLAFSDLPDELRSARNFTRFEKSFKDYLYRHCPLVIYKTALHNAYAPAGSDQHQARQFFANALRQERDLAMEKLRDKCGVKIAALKKRMDAAQQRIDREQSQYSQQKMDTLVNLGASILGAFMGRKVASRANVSKMSTAARGAGRVAQEKSDVARAEETMQELQRERDDLERELHDAIDRMADDFDPNKMELEEIIVPPRKSDMKIGEIEVVWTPWQVDASGIATPLY